MSVLNGKLGRGGQSFTIQTPPFVPLQAVQGGQDGSKGSSRVSEIGSKDGWSGKGTGA